MASSGTLMPAADFSPCALVWSIDHCDSHARRVEKRAMPTGPLFAVYGGPMKQAPGSRSFGSMVGSRKRGSAIVR